MQNVTASFPERIGNNYIEPFCFQNSNMAVFHEKDFSACHFFSFRNVSLLHKTKCDSGSLFHPPLCQTLNPTASTVGNSESTFIYVKTNKCTWIISVCFSAKSVYFFTIMLLEQATLWLHNGLSL